jgi:transposase
MEPANPECPGCAAAAAKIAALERQIETLQQTVESLSRSAKRQAAPFSRNLPKANPQKPGRKAGEDYGVKAFRPVPPRMDEIHEAPLPQNCPRCGGTLEQTHVDHQYQVEIPRRPIYRQFVIALGRCTSCHRQVHGRHPLQTSDALGCCQSQVGPEAQAAVALLNKDLGLSQGKISRFFQMFFGIKITRGGSCQIMQRVAECCESHYAAIVTRVRESPFIVPDETGWRIGGKLAWLHVAAGDYATAYLIAQERGKAASDLLIGPDYAGTLIHDGWSPYDRYAAASHQTCLGHLLVRCKELLERARGGAVIFPRQVKKILKDALDFRDLRDQGKITPKRCAGAAGGLEYLLRKLVDPVKTHAAHERLAGHLQRHLHQLFTFLRTPGIDATNHRAEQAIRPAVVNRKVWGGSRTLSGALAQSIMMSILVTLRQNRRDALEFLSRQLQSPQLIALPLPAG